MIVLGVVFLPLLMVPVVLLLRRDHWAPAVATVVALVATGALAVSQVNVPPLVVLGRAIGFTPLTAGAVALGCALLAATALHTVAMPIDNSVHALSLAAMAALAGGVAIRNATIGGLVLEIGIFLAILLIPLRHRDATLDGSRAMVIAALLLPLILSASITLGSGGSFVAGEGTNTGLLALAGLLLLALGLVPFHVWLMGLFRRGPAPSVVMLTVVLGLMVLTYAAGVLQWPEQSPSLGVFSTVLLAAGLGSVLLGGMAALGQRSLGRVIGYAALADLGVAFIGLGLEGASNLVAAIIHVVYRGVAVTAAAIALGVFRRRLGGDDDYHLRGALRKAPLSVLGVTLACLSLTGLPLTAGFGTRLLILTSLARQSAPLAVLAVAFSLGPLWALGRCLRAAFSPILYVGDRREPRLSGVLVLFLGALLLVWGIVPRLVPFLPISWLSGQMGGG